jgi:hypothetical protein
MRHINIGYMAVLDADEHKEIESEHIKGELNPANILTKEDGIAEKFPSLCYVIVPLHPDGGVQI